jgi:hypothetical protein
MPYAVVSIPSAYYLGSESNAWADNASLMGYWAPLKGPKAD